MQNEADWIAYAVSALRRSGSWTGRIHVHKLIFTCQVLGLANPPFKFELYQYGPYAREIDNEISIMEAFGGLTKEFPKPGYGPKYKVGIRLDNVLPPQDANAMTKVADAFGSANSSELELIATCLWVEKVEKVIDDTEIADRVHKIKPKYKVTDINDHLLKARDLARQVTVG